MVKHGIVHSKRSLGLVIDTREVHRDPLVNDLMGNYEGMTFANEGLVLWFGDDVSEAWRSGYHLEVISMIDTTGKEE